MDYKVEYKQFIEWITDPGNSGLMGPIIYTKEEAAFDSLFAAYLNCRYPPNAVLTSAMHSDGDNGAHLEAPDYPMGSGYYGEY